MPLIGLSTRARPLSSHQHVLNTAAMQTGSSLEWETLTDRPDGSLRRMVKPGSNDVRNALLDAAEAVVVRQGIANLTLDAVAAEAGMSKGGLLHHFPNKDRLVEAMVQRSADGWRRCYTEAYEMSPEGPGRMARGLLNHCFTKGWTEQLRRSSSAVFAALAHNPSLIEPMRTAYTELYRRVAEDQLPPGVGEAVVAAVDGLWLDWVLGLVPVDEALVSRVRASLEEMLTRSQGPPARLPRPQDSRPNTVPALKRGRKNAKRSSRGYA